MTAPFAPIMLTPNQPGQLSNTRGSNFTTDVIALKARQSNPKGAASPLSVIRMQAFRTGLGGLPSAAQLAWDSGWAGGTPAVQQLPSSKQACGGNSTVTYGGRQYFMPSDGQIMSAPVPVSIGTWRLETPLPIVTPGVSPTVYAMTQVAGRLYATASNASYLSSAASLYVSTINADGTLGAWQIVPGGIITQSDATWKNAGLCGFWDGKSSTGFLVTWTSTPTCNTVAVNVADGSITTALSASVNPTFTRDNLTSGVVVVNAGQGWIFLIGGSAAAASAVVDGEQVNTATGVMSGVFAAKQALPAVRTGGTLIALQNNTLYYIGGSSTNVASGVVNTVYFNSVANILAPVAWTASAQVLPAAIWLAGGGVVASDYDLVSTGQRVADSVTETISGPTNPLAPGETVVIASFKAATTIALVGVAGAFTTGTATSVSPAFGQATTIGHLLVAWVSGSANPAPGITTGQAGWVKAVDSGGAGSAQEATIWYKPNCAAGETAPTFTSANGSSTMYAQLAEFSGALTASPLDQTGFVFPNAGVTTLTATNSAADSAGGDLIVTASRWAMGTSGTSTFVDTGNNATPISIGHTGNPAQTRYANFTYAIAPTAAPNNRFPYVSLVGGQLATGTNQAGVLAAAVNVSAFPNDVRTWSVRADSGSCVITTTPSLIANPSGVLASFKAAAGLTIARVGALGAFATGAATTVSPAFGQATTAGNLLVAWVASDTAAPTTAAAGWVQAVVYSFAGGDFTAIWYKPNCGAAEAAPTFTDASGVNPMKAQLGEFSGAATASPLDQTASANNPGPTVSVTAGAADAANGDLVLLATDWPLSLAGTATFAESFNNGATAVHAGDDGASSLTFHRSFAYGIVTNNQTAGPGTAAVVGNLGTNAGLINNQDGTQDVTINYGAQGTLNGIAVGTVVVAAFADGDQVTLNVQMVGLDGEPSPVGVTLFKVGQAPSISLITPSGATTDGRPLVSFSYLPGAGGDLEQTYQIQVKLGSAVVFDSGVRSDGANAVQALLAPYLVSTTTYTISVSVTSRDSPMGTSTNAATATATFTPTVTSPGTPSAPSATPNHPAGNVALAWTNNAPAGTTPGDRVYYRRSLPADPGFELAGLGVNWISNPTGTGTVSIVSAGQRSGAKALQLTNPSLGNYGGTFTRQGVQVQPGQVVTASVWAKGSVAGTTGPFRIVFANPGSAISVLGVASTQPSAQAGVSVNDLNMAVTTSYQLFTNTLTVPAGFTWMFVEVYANAAATFPTLTIDDLGLTPFYLLADLGQVTSLTAMDELALGVNYDFCVTQVDNSVHAESPQSPYVSALIDPTQGNYAGMLHIAGLGTTYFALLKAQGSPTWETRIDSNILDMFGQLAPVVRYGVRYYHMVKLKNFLANNPTDIKNLIGLIQQAVLGLTVYYRDAFGALVTVAIAPQQALQYRPALYRFTDLDMVQIPNAFQPSTSIGSAQGYRQQATGSVIPLDSSEQVV